MNKLSLRPEEPSFKDILSTFERRVSASTPGCCPVDLTKSFLVSYHCQSCGKCTPCRIGIGQAINLLEDLLDGKASEKTLPLLLQTANTIAESSDCEIGASAGKILLFALSAFKEDFASHYSDKKCAKNIRVAVPCVHKCPAEVDVPGYISLVSNKRYKDAVRLIKKDNPFPVACAYVCEHPCEEHCRRTIVDAPLNIRGMKLAAITSAGKVPSPLPFKDTGKKIAIVGGGPSGLTAAYYLRLMGHSVSLFERNPRLGGMLYFGIPRYRLPKKELDRDIEAIISTGVDVHLNTNIGTDITIDKLRKDYDAVYIALGAQNDKKVGIEGEDANNVISAVELLHAAGDLKAKSMKGKRVAVIGGGNVAMDCTRTALRLGADHVTTVYRRRKEDMTALECEIDAAINEGAEILELNAPVKIEVDKNGNATGLRVSPKIIGNVGRDGRPAPHDSSLEEQIVPADIIVVAIGQGIDSKHFEEAGIPCKWGCIVADKSTAVQGVKGVFSGGDCVTGPSSAINAIAAGKVAARNIDDYLGFNNELKVEINIPEAEFNEITPCGRINVRERRAEEAICDFNCVELPLTEEEVMQESSRCLRCDRFGLGAFKNGREIKW